jgi:hypothetical protein
MTMVLAYRSDEDVLQARLGSLLESRSAEVASVDAEVRNIYSRRVARSIGGGVASVGGAALLVGGALRCAATRISWMIPEAQPYDGVLVALLGGSVVAGLLAYAAARLVANRSFDRAMSDAVSLSGNARIDLVRVERARPLRIARDLIERHEARSASLPLVAAALLAPLAIHLLAWMMFGWSSSRTAHLGDFDRWIAMSAPIAGAAHLVLALCAAKVGSRLREQTTAQLRLAPSRDGWVALAYTAIAGMIPGALLILIPPILIGVTGLLFIPLSFSRMNRTIVGEREDLGFLAA